MQLHIFDMEHLSKNKIIALLLLLAGIAMLLKTCSSSAPIDVDNPQNQARPQRLGQNIQKWGNIKAAGDKNFTKTKAPVAIAPKKIDSDLLALKKAQKKYEESLKKNKQTAKKKTTKKKKARAKKQQRQEEGISHNNKQKHRNKRALSGTFFGGGLATGNAMDNATNKPDQTGQGQNVNPESSYAGWRNIVFSNPSQQSAEQLLAAYLQNRIPAEWFYGITSEMLNSSNGILQESAINLLAMTPSSISFKKLSHVQEDRSMSNAIKALARESMSDVYKNISYLNILSTEVQTSDTTTAFHAARMILVSAEINMRNQGLTYLKRSTSSANPFSNLVVILRRVVESTSNERLQTFAQSALDYISQNLSKRRVMTAQADRTHH